MTTTTQTVSLADFGPDSVWLVSVGIRMGQTVELTGIVDDETGETYDLDPWDAAQVLPFDPSEVFGTVKDGEWSWDGEGHPTDWNRNTITALTATRS